MKNQQKTPYFQEIYGYHSVLAALRNPKRQHLSLFILEKYENLIKKYLKIVPKIITLSKKEMSKLYGIESVTQGIVLKTSPVVKKNFNDVLNDNKNKKNSIIIVLDKVTDPQNIGSIMRSCALFKCEIIIAAKDNAPNITPSMSKAASGALEIVNYIKIINLKRALKDLKKVGYWIYGLDSSAKKTESYIDLPNKCVLVLGSEGKGIREQIKKECDMLVCIPSNANQMYGIESLNVSNACAISLYEYFKKFNN